MPGGNDLSQRARDQVSDQGYWVFQRLDILREVFGNSNDLSAEGAIAAGTASNAGAYATGLSHSQGTAAQGLNKLVIAHGNVPAINVRLVLPDNLSSQVPIVNQTASATLAALKQVRGSAIQIGFVIKQTYTVGDDTSVVTMAAGFSRYVPPTGSTPTDKMAGTSYNVVQGTSQVRTGNTPTYTALVVPAARGVLALTGTAGADKTDDVLFDLTGCLTTGDLFPRARDILVAKLTPSGNTNGDLTILAAYARYRCNLAPDAHIERDRVTI